MFIIREVNSDMPIYILTEQMSEKLKCPERDSNLGHPDLTEGALTTELARQPQWTESNIWYKRNIDYQTFAPRPLGLGITSGGHRDAMPIREAGEKMSGNQCFFCSKYSNHSTVVASVAQWLEHLP